MSIFIFPVWLFSNKSFCALLYDLLNKLTMPYLRESSAHPFRGFLSPKNRVRIRIDGALDAHTKSETTISLSVES